MGEVTAYTSEIVFRIQYARLHLLPTFQSRLVIELPEAVLTGEMVLFSQLQQNVPEASQKNEFSCTVFWIASLYIGLKRNAFPRATQTYQSISCFLAFAILTTYNAFPSASSPASPPKSCSFLGLFLSDLKSCPSSPCPLLCSCVSSNWSLEHFKPIPFQEFSLAVSL